MNDGTTPTRDWLFQRLISVRISVIIQGLWFGCLRMGKLTAHNRRSITGTSLRQYKPWQGSITVCFYSITVNNEAFRPLQGCAEILRVTAGLMLRTSPEGAEDENMSVCSWRRFCTTAQYCHKTVTRRTHTHTCLTSGNYFIACRILSWTHKQKNMFARQTQVSTSAFARKQKLNSNRAEQWVKSGWNRFFIYSLEILQARNQMVKQ